MVHITRGLLEAILEVAEDRDPSSVTIALAVTPAGEFEADLDPDTPVYTDMYLPSTGGSVAAVFGMDLSTPGAAGRFVSHPGGTLALAKTDDLHQVVFVGVPPYELDCVAAFDRSGREVAFDVVDAEPPERQLEDFSP